MPKKIIDIFPPANLSGSDFFEKKPTPDKKKRQSKMKKLTLGIFLFLILLLVYLHFFLAKAEIIIRPKTQILEFNQKVVVSSQLGLADKELGKIPGKIFEVEKTLSDEFLATGSLLKKAEGTIRLYNNFTTKTETWRQGTRFVSSEGKLFLSKDKIQVPSVILKDGKIVPSFVDVPVVATEGGEEYNIGPSKFSIVAFLGTPRYTKYYGESFQPMRGGGQVSQMTKEDLEKAQALLFQKAMTELEADLRKNIPEGFVFLSQAGEMKILEKNSSADPGTETDKFKFQIRAKLTTLSFNLKDIEDFASRFILSKIRPEQKLHRESLNLQYSKEALNLDIEELVLSVNFSAKIYPDFNLDSLQKALAGKSLTEAKILLNNELDIVSYEMYLFPFWLKTIPEKLDKIKVELSVD